MTETRPPNPSGDDPVNIGVDRLVLAISYISRGFSVEETAARLGCPLATLRGALSFFGVRGRNVGRGARRLDLVVSADVWPLLESAAGLRGVEPYEMAERAIEILFGDPELLKNILEDGKDVR